MSSNDVGSYEFKRTPCEMQMEECSATLARSTSDGSADYYFYYYYSYRRCTQRGPVDASSVNACHGEGRACGMLNLAVAVGFFPNSGSANLGF